uniref:Peptidase M16 C-terminal domain-containing protein n=1 Tax=Plectus sambesii TaxID=2011161 RepID=A0A914WAZ5_9BILA
MTDSDMQSLVRSIWRATTGVKVNDTIPIVKYISQRSGLCVAIADVPGPMVNGNLCFVTETDSDDGLPHTLEHLVFMGSERRLLSGRQVLAAVESVEERILQDPQRSEIRRNFVRPFRSPIEPLKQSVDTSILCPSDDESSGVVQISWRGPPAQDLYKATALEILFGYMESTAVSPLQRDFIQLADPFCSEVSFSCLEQSVGEIVLSFEGVPTDKLAQIRPRLFKETVAGLLKREPVAFDMERLHFVIDQAIRRSLSKLETKPSDTISHMIISDHLYGESEADFKTRMNEVSTYKKLKNEPALFWIDLLDEFIGPQKPYVCVVGQPSAECVEKVAETEDLRVETQQDRLGEEGLQKCAENLEKAIHANMANQPPDSVLNEFIVRNFDGFSSFKINELSNLLPSSESNPRFDVASLPFGATVHDCKTTFVDVVMAMDTSEVPEELRRWLMLWFELMFESAAEIDGHWLPYEEVTKRYTGDLVSQSMGLGVGGLYSRFACLRVKVDAESYHKAAKWVRTFLKGVRFDAERVRVTAQKLANEAAAAKREGNDVSATLLKLHVYQPESNVAVYNLIRLESFHSDVAAAAELRPNEVVAKLEKLRQLITAPENTIMHVSCDVDAVHAIVGQPLADAWKNVLDGGSSGDGRAKGGRPPFDPNTREPLFLNDAGFGSAVVTAVGASESGFLNQVARMIDDCCHEDLPATLLLIQYLSQTEGPLWRNIRGKGLAYGANIFARPEKGLISLSLYRSAQLVQAYEETARLIAEVLSGEHQLVESEFEAAKRSLVYEVVAQEQTVKAACDQATLSYYRRVPLDYNRQLTKRIWAVKIEELREKGAKHIAPLFSFDTAVTSIAVHPSKLDEVTEGFKKLGRPLENINLDSERVCLRYAPPQL